MVLSDGFGYEEQENPDRLKRDPPLETMVGRRPSVGPQARPALTRLKNGRDQKGLFLLRDTLVDLHVRLHHGTRTSLLFYPHIRAREAIEYCHHEDLPIKDHWGRTSLARALTGNWGSPGRRSLCLRRGDRLIPLDRGQTGHARNPAFLPGGGSSIGKDPRRPGRAW